MMRPMLAAALALHAGGASAQSLRDGWTGRATAYGWFTAAELDSAVALPGGGSLDSSVSIGFDDVLDALDFAAFANAEARRGRLVLLGDFLYTKLSADGEGPLGATIRAGMKTVIGSGAVGWEVWSDDRARIDAFGGVRIVYADVDLSRSGAVAARQASASETFADPLIGAQIGWRASDRLDLRASADLGGFGVGSDLSWEVFAGGAWAISDRVSSEVGFRYLSIDYENDGTAIDLQLYGPVAGLSITF